MLVRFDAFAIVGNTGIVMEGNHGRERWDAFFRTRSSADCKALATKVPIAELIGFREEIGGGRTVCSLRSGPQHANPMGTLHGGMICDLADAAMDMAFLNRC